MSKRIDDPSFAIQGTGRPSAARSSEGGSRVVKRAKPTVALDHLAFVRTLPCCACGTVPAGHAHHLLRGVLRGMGMRAADRWAIPLCPPCHDPNHSGSLHHSGDETGWLRSRRVPGLFIAAALWALRDVPEPERSAAAGEIVTIKGEP